MSKLVFILVCLVIVSSCAADKTQDWNTLIGWSGLVDQKKLDAGNHWAIDNDVELYVVIPIQEVLDESFHAELLAF